MISGSDESSEEKTMVSNFSYGLGDSTVQVEKQKAEYLCLLFLGFSSN